MHPAFDMSAGMKRKTALVVDYETMHGVEEGWTRSASQRSKRGTLSLVQ